MRTFLHGRPGTYDCICGHQRAVHDYTGDGVEVDGWGVCEARTCPCDQFKDVDVTDEIFLERLGVAS